MTLGVLGCIAALGSVGILDEELTAVLGFAVWLYCECVISSFPCQALDQDHQSVERRRTRPAGKTRTSGGHAKTTNKTGEDWAQRNVVLARRTKAKHVVSSQEINGG